LSTKLTKGNTLGLIGLEGKKVISIKNTICWRKPATIKQTRQVMKRYKYAIGVVSSHNIYRKANTPYCKIWCHCFRDVDKYLKGYPSILLSESDFVDPAGIRVLKRRPRWDFYYFTMGGKLGNMYKGMQLFVDSLPILCGRLGLKGVVIKYAKSTKNFMLSRKQRRIWNKYKPRLEVFREKKNTASIMSRCKFGFFPNIQDCSPLLLTESLVRECPILVNEDILGGWKYVNDETGSFFTKDNLEEKANFVLNSNFSTRKNYMKQYGYKKTAVRLAEFCNKHIPGFNFSMVGFKGSDRIMRSIKND